MGLSEYINASLALAFVLCLLGLFSLFFRKFILKENFSNRLNKRLRINESLIIDQKRKLLLVQRDNVEHLILASPEGNLIVENNIKAVPDEKKE